MARSRGQHVGPLFLVVGLALAAALLAWSGQALLPEPDTGAQDGPQRIVSLSPAMTETLFALDAGGQVVGVSEYTQSPREARDLPRAGTAIAPDFEQLVRLRPTLIVAESTSGPRLDQLRLVASTRVLPWLSTDDVVAGVRELGRLTGRSREAATLARHLETRLARQPAPDAPRVLLVLGYAGDRAGQLWFVRRNSIHGAALQAAGARNAIDEDIVGPPNISAERLLAVDPEIIIVLAGQQGDADLASLRGLDALQAVRRGRVGVLEDPGGLIPGPRILDLVDALEVKIRALGGGV